MQANANSYNNLGRRGPAIRGHRIRTEMSELKSDENVRTGTLSDENVRINLDANSDINVRTVPTVGYYFVPQEDPNGCAIACVAMVMNWAYRDVRTALGLAFCNHCGVTDELLDGLLANHRYAIARKFMWDPMTRAPRESWPPKPFAPIHIAKVRRSDAAPLAHAVIMLDNGAILDPETNGSPLELSDYWKVISVTGVVRF
jgi:hypothetical protein